jgi:hypothetical protein
MEELFAICFCSSIIFELLDTLSLIIIFCGGAAINSGATTLTKATKAMKVKSIALLIIK